jgi:hypothetical protein
MNRTKLFNAKIECSAQNGVMYFYDNFLLKLTLKLYKYITGYSGVTADIEFLS